MPVHAPCAPAPRTGILAIASRSPRLSAVLALCGVVGAPAWAGHSRPVHRRDGGIVKALALHGFLREPEWACVVHGRSMRVHWLQEYPGLTDLTAPRVEHAFHRISPDHTVLEFTIGTAAMVKGAVAARNPGAQLKPRVVRVSLTDGRIFADDEIPRDVDQTPVRPFLGDPIKTGGIRMMERYRASLGPLRIAGTCAPESDRARPDGPER